MVLGADFFYAGDWGGVDCQLGDWLLAGESFVLELVGKSLVLESVGQTVVRLVARLVLFPQVEYCHVVDYVKALRYGGEVGDVLLFPGGDLFCAE